MPVWLALSELFLDSEPTPEDHRRIAVRCGASPYSVEKLNAILENELYPPLIGNLLVMSGGEWGGFGEEWIRKEIAPRIGRRRRLPFPPLMRWMYRDHWMKIKTVIEEMRGASNQQIHPIAGKPGSG